MISRPSQLRIALPYEEIEALCQKYKVAELSIFGSALREDFHRESDVDFMIVFEDDADYGPWMSKLTDFKNDLEHLLGRTVDVVPRSGVERSENYIRRKHILDSAQTVYVA